MNSYKINYPKTRFTIYEMNSYKINYPKTRFTIYEVPL